MKKKFLFFILGACLFLSPALSLASVNYEWNWKYVFHFQLKNDVLGIDSSAEQPYDPVPESYNDNNQPSAADYYGDIISVKGKNLSRFGFNKPQTIVVALQKSIFDVSAPFYADADHVSIFTRSGSHLFDISLKKTSFCNDDNKCNIDVGENFLNCPNDCKDTSPQYVEPPINPTPDPTTIEPQPIPTPTTNPQNATTGEVVTSSSGTKKFFTPGVIMMLVGGSLLVILGIILLRIKKNMD